MFSGMNYVYEVYKAKSFSKAAQNLYISQPSLSAMIKKIENKVGAPLFDRSTNPIGLTEYGKRYIRIAEKIMDLEDEFAYYTDNLNELKTGHLSIGTTSFYAAFILPQFISQFTKLYPHVKVKLFEGHSHTLEQMASAGDLDLVIDNYQVTSDSYEHHTVLEEHMLLAVPAKFASNHNVTEYQLSRDEIIKKTYLQTSFPGVPLQNFEEDPFITLRLPNDTRKRMEIICQNAGIKFKPILKLDQLLTTYHLTEYGMGISLLSDIVAQNLPSTQNIIYYKLDDPHAVRNVILYYRNNKYLTRSMLEFIKIACAPQ